MTPVLQTPRATETESVIDSSAHSAASYHCQTDVAIWELPHPTGEAAEAVNVLRPTPEDTCSTAIFRDNRSKAVLGRLYPGFYRSQG